MDDVSPSTRLAIHADEGRVLRWTILQRSPFLILATLLWIAVGARLPVSLTTRLENRLKQSPLEYAAATALGIPALIADDPPSSQQGRVDETLSAIATAQKALRARLAQR